MSVDSAMSSTNPWAQLQTLLRKGPAAIDILGSTSQNLFAILEENDRLFNAMVDAFDGMIYICSTDYRIEYLNDRMIEHLGGDATGEFCYRAFGRASVCPWCINHRIMKGEMVRWEVVSPRDARWYLVVNAPIRHIDGTVSKYAMMMDIHDRKLNEEELNKHRDHLEDLIEARTAELTYANAQLRLEIEDRKAIEKNLRESEQRYRTLFDGSRDAIFISDANGRIMDANDAATLLTGYSKLDLIPKLVQDLDSVIDLNAYQKYFKRIQRGDSFTREIAIRRKDGQTIYAEFNSKRMTLAGIPCIHTTARDITARRESEEALRQSEAKYRELVQNANSLIVRFDTEGRVKFFNEFAQQFFGYTEEEILGRSVLDTILPTVRSNGRSITSQNDEGKVVEFLWVGVDASERNQSRRQIQRLTHELIKAQENERYRIARDLHDHIAQDLSSLKIHLTTLFDTQTGVSEESRRKMDETAGILQRSIADVRNLAYDLRPPGLDQLGLVRTLFLYCEDFAQGNNLKIDFIAAGLDDLVLDEDIQINLYRLIQEALHNVKKHAEARGVTIRLVTSSPNLMLRIIDDGKGFDVNGWRAKSYTEKRMGLQSMVERVQGAAP
ncbi:MAG: PAS domain S-box protein [Desulfobacterales bacterium]|nr:PAS domain S-box protein [Desulfobacterales bacterium]